MHLILTLFVLMSGYLLLVYAAKQQKFHKTLGTFISWLVMVLATICLVCGISKYVKHRGCSYSKSCHYSKHGQHHKGEHKGEHSHEHHEEKSD